MRIPLFREAFGVRTRPRVAFDRSLCDLAPLIGRNIFSGPTAVRVVEEI
jgi:hypothetical protein